MQLAGKTALVTGASGAIGRAIALALARAGAAVAVSGLEPDLTAATAAAVRQAGAEAYARPARLHDRAEVRALLADVLAHFSGRLDILVNNAGMSHREPVLAVSEATFDEQWAVNFGAAFWLSQGAAMAMQAHGGGVILFTSSTGAIAAHADMCIYDATKAALEALTRNLALELGPHGIRVNAVEPGHVPVKDELRQPPTAAQLAGWQFVPLARAGQPEDIAEAMLFLASPAASYISGTVLRVDGGRTARLPAVIPVSGA